MQKQRDIINSLKFPSAKVDIFSVVDPNKFLPDPAQPKIDSGPTLIKSLKKILGRQALNLFINHRFLRKMFYLKNFT